MNRIVTAVELNRTGINLVTGYVFQDKVYVLYADSSEALPLDESGYLEKNKASEVLIDMVKSAETKLNRQLNDFICLFPPENYQVRYGNIGTVTCAEGISHIDYQNCILMINKECKVEGESIVYNDPIHFINDTTGKTYEFPLNKKSERLIVETAVHLISTTAFEHYRQIIRDAGINPFVCLVSTFASSYFLSSFKAPNIFYQLEIENDYSCLSLTRDKHLVNSRIIFNGMNHVYDYVAKKLSITRERAKQLADMFGLKDEAGFLFATRENLSLKQLSDAFKEGLERILPKKEEIDSLCNSPLAPIILIGVGRKIDGIDKFILDLYQRQTMTFSPKVIGARNEKLIPCLGGIRVSDNTFLEPTKENLSNANHFSRSSFSRG